MNIHNLVQGTPEWHAHRANYFNASEAPAMLGVSKYTTRDQLIHSMATGLTKEVDASTQKIFDNGHKFEALARPIAEKIIGEDLYPVVGSMGEYSASFDGITMGEDIIFEHKTLNDELRECFANGEQPPLMYRVQMEQQLMVSGAEKCLFMASKWNGEELVEENHFWYTSDAELRSRIVEGWNQFATDIATYVPPVKVQKVEAETIQTLPVPSVVVRGEITASNLGDITPMFDKYLGEVKTEFSTDQDFADAEANGNNCEETEKRIKALRENIIAQMVDINTVDTTLANYQEAFRKLKVLLRNAVKEQKDTIKSNAIMAAKTEYADFVAALNKDIPVMLSRQLQYPDFAAAIKSVKTLKTMHANINSALANGKVEATTLANNVKTKLAYISESIKGYEHLFKIDAIVFSDLDYIKLHIQSVKDAEDVRKAKHEAAIKEQAEADARAKLEREAKEKAEAEAKRQAEIAAKEALEKQIIEQQQTSVNEALQNEVKPAVATKPAEPETQYFYGNAPTVSELVKAVAVSFKVSEVKAHEYLLKADFLNYVPAKLAA